MYTFNYGLLSITSTKFYQQRVLSNSQSSLTNCWDICKARLQKVVLTLPKQTSSELQRISLHADQTDSQIGAWLMTQSIPRTLGLRLVYSWPLSTLSFILKNVLFLITWISASYQSCVCVCVCISVCMCVYCKEINWTQSDILEARKVMFLGPRIWG